MRTLIKDTVEKIDQEVEIKGWVRLKREHGKIVFFDIEDRSALIQTVIFSKNDNFEKAKNIKPEEAVYIKGIVHARPENAVNPKLITGKVELEIEDIEVIGKSETLPFDMGGIDLKLELPTLLDFRSLTLKHETQRDIFKIQASIAEEFRNAAEKLDATEIFVPTIAAGASEGGADVFSVNYYGHHAYMIQSPQLYKQMMVGILERVFTISKAYRAEPSVTTRHLSEVTMMDVEIAFVEKFEELLDAVEFVGSSIVKNVTEKHKNIFEKLNIEMPLIPNSIPRLKLREAQEIITKRTGRDLSKEMDLNPEDEKEICAWAREEHKSDFVTITHYPTKKRAFYTYPDPENPEYSLSYDLLFRGAEILSGSKRINDYEKLLEVMKQRNVNPKNFGMYLMAFKYGMPPEGGFSFGLERLTMKILELDNIRKAVLFPRDMERIDERLSQLNPKAEK